MSPSATLYLHLDHRAVHEAKVLCDELFGAGAFRGEIIWAPGNGGARARGPSVTHQTILVFSATPRTRATSSGTPTIPTLREPLRRTSLDMHFKSATARRPRVPRAHHRRQDLPLLRRRGPPARQRLDRLPAMVANTPLRKRHRLPHAEARAAARAHRARRQPAGRRGRRSHVRQRHDARRRGAARPALRRRRRERARHRDGIQRLDSERGLSTRAAGRRDRAPHGAAEAARVSALTLSGTANLDGPPVAGRLPADSRTKNERTRGGFARGWPVLSPCPPRSLARCSAPDRDRLVRPVFSPCSRPSTAHAKPRHGQSTTRHQARAKRRGPAPPAGKARPAPPGKTRLPRRTSRPKRPPPPARTAASRISRCKRPRSTTGCAW